MKLYHVHVYEKRRGRRVTRDVTAYAIMAHNQPEARAVARQRSYNLDVDAIVVEAAKLGVLFLRRERRY